MVITKMLQLGWKDRLSGFGQEAAKIDDKGFDPLAGRARHRRLVRGGPAQYEHRSDRLLFRKYFFHRPFASGTLRDDPDDPKHPGDAFDI